MAKKNKGVEGADPAKKKEQEPNPYKVSWFDKIPYWIKAVFVKWWFFGVIYFFFVMGLGAIIGSGAFTAPIQMIVIGLAFGIITDFMVNPILGLLESNRHESFYWCMWRGKKFYIFIVNLVYGFALGVAASLLCALFVTWIDGDSSSNVTYFFREPCSFALVALLIDLACIWLKNLIVFLIKRNDPQKEGKIKK